MKEPPLPCETTTSGSLLPLMAQSFTPGRVKLPKTISPGGSEQGYHIARSEEHTSELQSHRDLHSFPTRRSSDLERQLVAADGTVLHPGQGKAAENDLSRWLGTRIPHRALERRSGVGRNVDEPKTGGVRRRRGGAKGERDKDFSHLHQRAFRAMLR